MAIPIAVVISIAVATSIIPISSYIIGKYDGGGVEEWRMVGNPTTPFHSPPSDSELKLGGLILDFWHKFGQM